MFLVQSIQKDLQKWIWTVFLRYLYRVLFVLSRGARPDLNHILYCLEVWNSPVQAP